MSVYTRNLIPTGQFGDILQKRKVFPVRGHGKAEMKL